MVMPNSSPRPTAMLLYPEKSKKSWYEYPSAHSQAVTVDSSSGCLSGGLIALAMVSAISTFSASPIAKNDQPRWRCSVRRAPSRCSRSCWTSRKRTIGPATSCENSETYAANSNRLPVGVIVPR